jgi:hypothetical protein
MVPATVTLCGASFRRRCLAIRRSPREVRQCEPFNGDFHELLIDNSFSLKAFPYSNDNPGIKDMFQRLHELALDRH